METLLSRMSVPIKWTTIWRGMLSAFSVLLAHIAGDIDIILRQSLGWNHYTVFPIENLGSNWESPGHWPSRTAILHVLDVSQFWHFIWVNKWLTYFCRTWRLAEEQRNSQNMQHSGPQGPGFGTTAIVWLRRWDNPHQESNPSSNRSARDKLPR